ncbi:starch-binding protein [Bifidobacterium boum]|uniref:Starch-binding protein n=1 Tax=Bifidobacterium boum TaxID=78343 RepID=A0A848D4U1_9BIFI|nr:S-layer homology domain-containing protein [Bifidobacterium boum]NMF01810.1 starch-binding protein [Bifidobacterium boum]
MLSTKIVAMVASVASLAAFAGVGTYTATSANAASTVTSTASATSSGTRDSYTDTVGNATFEAARQKYGLAKDMKDGATLHAFEWSFKTIEENIPDIAKAGYTSIQTEPIVKIKDNRKLGTGNWYLNWYYIYQPTDMAIGNYVVGSEAEFKSMCKKAHEYGLRVIVDSVSNHFTSDFDVIADKWRNKNYFHEDKQISDYNNREDCTQHKLTGLWDLNTQDDTVTQGMADLLKQTVADGADGFRYDAAKHIELPDEVFGKQSNYWNTILKNGAQYQYGEVLEDANVREADYANLFWNSSVAGGGITDSSYGHEVRNGVQHGNLSASHFTQHNKVSEDKTVNWVESHDNFANGEANIPQELSDEWIKYGWAGVTAQKNGMSLFFDRPYKDGGTYGTGGKGTYGNGSGPFTENSKLGDAGSDLWKDPEVVAVNHFRNSMIGENSNVSNCGDDLCLMVERYAGSSAQDGVVVANANGSAKNLAGTSTKLANGTYTDEVTGSTITVSGGTITSGSVNAKAIAAFSNKTRSEKISTAEAYPNKGTIPGTSKKITLRAYQATNTTYTTSDGQSGSYSDGDVIKIGANAKKGDVLKVTVKGTGADGQAITHTYSYAKQGDPTYDPSDGTQSPCDKYCVTYMQKNGYNPDTYIDSEETDYEGGSGVDATGVSISGDGVSNGKVSRDISSGDTSLTLKATVTPSDASQRVTWSSSDDSVAAVSSEGKVSLKKAGTVTITATTSNGKTATVTITVTGEAPKATNVVYAAKPSNWSKIYAYVYVDGSTNNAKWPGVEMTAISGTDTCGQSGYYYDVPDNLASNAKVIFNDGGSQQVPGANQAGISYNGGTVRWSGSGTTIESVTCQTLDVPVSSVAVSGSGVSNGKLSLEKGKSAQLSATVNPSNATNRTVTWSSSNASVASVTGTGYVSAVKAGTATVTASAGGKSASVRVTVTDPSSSQRFSDVPSSAWYASSVDWAASNGVVSGYGDGRFGPADSVSRAQMAGLLYNLAVKEGDAKAVSYKTPKSSSFSDVPVSAWYAKQVSWAAAYGVVSGYGNGRFGPADMVSRGQAAAMLRNFARYRGVSGSSASASFSDVPSGAWYASSVSWVVSNGVASGYGNGKFGPSDVASRAQAVAMLQKLDKLTASPASSSSLSISGDGVSDGKLSLARGGTVQLSAVNVPSGAPTVTWWSDDDAVAVTGTGLVIGVKAGSGVVHVQAGGQSAVLTVTVK